MNPFEPPDKTNVPNRKENHEKRIFDFGRHPGRDRASSTRNRRGREHRRPAGRNRPLRHRHPDCRRV